MLSIPMQSSTASDDGSRAITNQAAGLPPEADYASLFRSSGNYREFITLALPAAKAGDAEAQYSIAAALQYCDETYRFYFKRRDRVLSVAEAIAVQTNRGDYRYIDALKLAASRCRDVSGKQDPAWGSTEVWLAWAARAGHPVAQFRRAMRIWMDMETNKEPPFRRDDGSPYSLDEVRSMIRAAARSAHPEVLFEVGGLGLVLKWDEEAEPGGTVMAWEYVACLRGLDCSAQAEWHRVFCTFDPECRPDEPGMDYLRRVALQYGLYDLEMRANLINERIDAGDWAALGLGD